MKTIIFLVICGICASQAADGEEFMKKAMATCASEIKLTADEMKIIQSPRSSAVDASAPSKNLQCFTLCFFKQLGLMTKDDNLDVEHMQKYLGHFFKDQDKASAVLKQCWQDASGKDACEKSFNFEVCCRKKMT